MFLIWWYFFYCFFIFGNKVLLCGSSWSRTCYVEQASLEFGRIILSFSGITGVCPCTWWHFFTTDVSKSFQQSMKCVFYLSLLDVQYIFQLRTCRDPPRDSGSETSVGCWATTRLLIDYNCKVHQNHCVAVLWPENGWGRRDMGEVKRCPRGTVSHTHGVRGGVVLVSLVLLW